MGSTRLKRNKRTLRARLKGHCLDGCNCHHLLPVHMGGTHELCNLCYMPIGEHEALHRELGDRPQLNFFQLREIALKHGGLL